MNVLSQPLGGSPGKSVLVAAGAGAVGIGATKNIAWIFHCTDSDYQEVTPSGTPLNGWPVVNVGSPKFEWFCNVPTASAGSHLDVVGSMDPTFGTPYVFAICPDLVAVGQYSSLQGRLLTHVLAGATTTARAWVSPFPFWYIRFVNGATAQGAAHEIVARVGVW